MSNQAFHYSYLLPGGQVKNITVTRHHTSYKNVMEFINNLRTIYDFANMLGLFEGHNMSGKKLH